MSPIYINNKKIESIYTNNQSIGKVYVGDVLVFQKNNYTGIPFIFTIDTTLGTGNSFNLPLRSGYNYNMLVDWGDGQTSEITSFDDVDKTHTYATGGEYQIKITGTCEAWYFFNGGDKLKLTSIDQWGNTGFISMSDAFSGCSKLTTVNDTDGTWCSNVVSMFQMFNSCSFLTTLDVSNWNVSNVTYMGGMFRGCSSLTTLDVSDWNVSNVTNMSGMFNRCSSLETLDVSNWNVSNVINMIAMFSETPLDTTSYDDLLIGWSGLPSLQPGVRLDANLSQYSCAAEEAHNTLTSSPNNWLIIDADLNVDSCDEPTQSPFIFTIDTSLGTGASMTLPLRSGYIYDFVVDWGDGTSSTVTSSSDSNRIHNYATRGTYQISISGTCTAWYFNNSDRLKLTSIDQWGNTGFINMSSAFFDCINLTTVDDVDGTWCSKVTNMGSMFTSCSLLTTLDMNNWNVSNVTNMQSMFNGCAALTTLDVSNWDVTKVTNMGYMFNYCTSLTTLYVNNWNVSNVTNMQQMFNGCAALTTLDVSNWNVSNVTSMRNMFASCSSLTTLDVSNWNVNNVTNMQSMFYKTPLDTASYDALLIGWSGLSSLQSNVTFNASLAKYSAGAAATARKKLTSAPNNWAIRDGGQLR